MTRAFCITAALSALLFTAADWTHWRGPEQTGVSREKDLPDKWSLKPEAPGSNLLWRKPFGCRSTPLVQNGRLFFLSTVGEGIMEQERFVCLNADTGDLHWEHRFNVFHTSIVSNRLGWTNPAADAETGYVYVHFTGGQLYCFDRDGKTVWTHSLSEEYGRVSGYGGRLTTPIVDGELVIIGMVNNSWGDQARGGNRFVAFDKKTGEVIWWSEPGGQVKFTYYSCPVIAVIKGERLLVTGGADGAVHAMRVRTGEKVWSYHFAQSVNSSVLVSGDRVYISHGEENHDTNIQGRLLCLDGGVVENAKPKLVWEQIGIRSGLASPMLHDGRLYVCDDSAKLYCFDAETGKQLWTYKYGRLSRGSPVWADGKIFLFDVNAYFHILKPGPTRCTELHKQFFPSNDASFVETNATPCIVNGRIYAATRDDMYCIGKKGHNTAPDPIPPMPTETPASPSAQPAWLQVVPGDVVLSPGSQRAFTARVFDDKGHFLREVKEVEWSLPTPPPPPNSKATPPPLRGAIDAAGMLTTSKEVPSQQGYVEAKFGNLTARSRVRVAPTLPIVPDLARVPEGATPGGWINVTGKFIMSKLDGQSVLKKLANDARPPFARANTYMGIPTMTDYTIQSDLLGKEVRGGLPDAGVVANRYYLLLDGKRTSDADEVEGAAPAASSPDEIKKRRLRILSWEGQRRVFKSVPFDWKPDTWYTLKLTVDYVGGKGIVRGKAWPADKPEPAEWTIETTDPIPNREGAPALYGYAINIAVDAVGTETYYRNIRVTPNQSK